MMQQQQAATQLPGEIQSPRAKLVYLYLSTHGSATVGDMQDALNMKKLSLYSILRTLTDQQLVARNAEQYTPR